MPAAIRDQSECALPSSGELFETSEDFWVVPAFTHKDKPLGGVENKYLCIARRDLHLWLPKAGKSIEQQYPLFKKKDHEDLSSYERRILRLFKETITVDRKKTLECWAALWGAVDERPKRWLVKMNNEPMHFFGHRLILEHRSAPNFDRLCQEHKGIQLALKRLGLSNPSSRIGKKLKSFAVWLFGSVVYLGYLTRSKQSHFNLVLKEYIATRFLNDVGVKTPEICLVEDSWPNQPSRRYVLMQSFEENVKDLGHTPNQVVGHAVPNHNQWTCTPRATGTQVSIAKNTLGLGPATLPLIALADRDALGKTANNKGSIPCPGSDKRQFLAFDNGHAFESFKPLDTLSDDGTLDPVARWFFNPTIHFDSYGVLYDTPLSEKMKGAHRLNSWLLEVFPDPDKIPQLISEDFGIYYQNHLNVFKEIEDLIEASPSLSFKRKKALNKMLNHIKKDAKRNVEHILKVFEKRLPLSIDELNMIEQVEHFLSKSSTRQSPNIELAQPYIPRAQRVAVQLENGELVITPPANKYTDIEPMLIKLFGNDVNIIKTDSNYTLSFHQIQKEMSLPQTVQVALDKARHTNTQQHETKARDSREVLHAFQKHPRAPSDSTAPRPSVSRTRPPIA